MASIESTVMADAEQFTDHLPDDYSDDTVEIGVHAFGDKVYLKFPRFDRSGTNDFAVKASSLFRATVHVRDEVRKKDIRISPGLSKLNAMRDDKFGDPEDVITKVFGDPSDAHETHLKLVEEFTTTIAGYDESEYWAGYRKGANVHGDDALSMADLAWIVFEDRWGGNAELLLEAGEWMAEEGMVAGSRSEAFFPIPEWTVPTGSYVATISAVYAGKCPFCGADKDEYWECIKSSNRTRVPNTYKCNKCGNTKKGITTG